MEEKTNGGKTFVIADLVRRDLKDMEPYHASVKPGRYRLDSNESPLGMPDGLRRRLTDWLENEENLNRYPDTDNTALRGAIAGMWGVGSENVTCGVGSDQLIDLLCRVFLEPGDTVVVPAPTFGMYAISACLNHGEVREVFDGFEGPDGDDLAERLVLAAGETKAKIVFLCSPNNPTGRSLPEDRLCFVAENAPGIVVVDEAYADFSRSTLIPRLREHPNVVVLRTFSKAFGLAGARVGYAVAGKEAIDVIDLAKPPFNLPTLSQLLAEWAIEDAGKNSGSDSLSARVDYLNEQREELYRELAKIPWLAVERSDANFLYVRSERDVAALLEENGISIRRFSASGKECRARITVGTAEENKKVVDVLCGVGRR
jgi:histidinol-phosphate aminotransferase